MFILHGILGSGRNWRAYARRLARLYPEWRYVLVDLRNHGDSHPATAPNTLKACADDLVELAEHLGTWPQVVIGHSFGGKVALAYGALRPKGLRSIWVLDSLPGAVGQLSENNEVRRVIEMAGSLDMPVPHHDAVLEHFTSVGLSKDIAGWMTTNLRRTEEGLYWRFDLPAIREMLQDYLVQDYWPFLEDTALDVHIVRAGRSERWSEDDIDRLDHLDALGRIHHHLLRDAGHWVHVDAPEELAEMLSASLA